MAFVFDLATLKFGKKRSPMPKKKKGTKFVIKFSRKNKVYALNLK
jgi:hypothetical protein